MRGDEVLKHGETFLEVCQDGVLDNLATFGTGFLRLSHKATHTGQLANLVLGTTSTGVEHHEYGVEALVGLGHLLHEDVGKAGVDVCPNINNLIVAFGVGNKAHRVVVHHFFDVGITFGHNIFLLFGDDNVAQVEGKTALEGHIVSEVLDIVQELSRARNTATFDDA